MLPTNPERPAGVTLADTLNHALKEILAADRTVLLMGEDVGRLGGVFRITKGLQEQFGADRVFDTPLSEGGVVGLAIGQALAGMRPIVEIQFDGFVLPALNQIIGHMAKMPTRLNHDTPLPVIVRLPFGGRIKATEFHSESPEALFVHSPELTVVAASRPETAGALLRSVVAAGNPTIFMEPKREYYRNRVDPALLVASLDHRRCEVVRTGTDVTLFTYGPTVSLGIEAAAHVLKQGINCAVVDLVSLAPLDVEGICSLARQTKRVIAISEAVERCSVASEVVSLIARNAFDSLEVAPSVVASPNRPPPPPAFEADYFPSVGRVCEAILRQCSDR